MKEHSSPSEEEKTSKLYEIEAYTLPLNELVEQLKTDLERGLSRKDAEERLQIFGLNTIPKIKSGFFRTYISPLMNWLIIIYLIISLILVFFAFFILPEVWSQVVQWLSVIAINATLAIVQQVRAQTNLEALTKLSAPKSKVIREASLLEIPSEYIVPGDIMEVMQGDRIPADARIITASNLKVNEASLTGESIEVEKFEGDMPVEKDTPISGRRNMIFLGTYVDVGSGKVLVVKTGRDTQLGKISKGIKERSTSEILLLQKINRVAKYLGFGVLIYIGISLTYHMIYLYSSNNLFAEGALNIDLVARIIVNSLVTAMSIMPINIPLLTTIIMITGILSMVKYQVVIRNMNAIESLGRVSVICSDKTGTITKNEMTVKWISLQAIDSKDYLYGVTGIGYQPHGKIITIDLNQNLGEIIKKEPEVQDGIEAKIKPETPLEYLLVSSMLNNDSKIIEDKVKTSDKKIERMVYKALGDATDASMLKLFGKSKLEENVYKSRFKEIYNYPLDSKLKRMTRVYIDNYKGKYAVFTKGATEVLLPLCNSICNKDKITAVKALDEGRKGLIDSKIDIFALSGHRVISLAFRYLNELPSKDKIEREFFENNLTYLGFIVITDPPREGVSEAVIEAKGAGINSVMITGDSLETARSIAQQVGIAQKDDLTVEGYDIDSLSDEEFSKTSVFARVSPEHKVIIVDRYKKQNRAVAMTGDGINDTLAISGADVGISMGITGTDVTKEAADMIITDDSFNSIVVGIREGRGIYQKIRSVVFFYIAINVAEALIFYGSSLIPNLYLLNTWQHIYIFMTAHSLPPFGLIIDRISKDVMKDKPRDREGINKQQKIAFLSISISLAFMFCIAYFGTLNGTMPIFEENKMGFIPNFSPYNSYNPINWGQAKARTMLLTVIFVSECTLIISMRRMNKPLHKILREDNYWIIWPFILAVPLAHLILMYIPEIQLLLTSIGINLEIIQLTWIDWIIATTLGLVPIALLESMKTLLRKHGLLF